MENYVYLCTRIRNKNKFNHLKLKVMGQYYKPVFLRKNYKTTKRENPVRFALTSYDFDNGAKLMEHSYCGNSYVNAAMTCIGEHYNGYPFVWCGDYADEVVCGGQQKDIYSCAISVDEKGSKLKSDMISRFNHNEFRLKNPYKYIINNTKKEYVVVPNYTEKEFTVHPLPLLCASGNGRGGGDYGLEDERVGRWAFDRISVSNSEADIDGLTEISGNFDLDD